MRCVDTTPSTHDAKTSQMPLVQFLTEENEWLKKRVEALEEELNESRQRSDTIILQLTRQFEEQTKLIEDMRQSRFEESRSAGRSLWSKVKTAFGFATS